MRQVIWLAVAVVGAGLVVATVAGWVPPEGVAGLLTVAAIGLGAVAAGVLVRAWRDRRGSREASSHDWSFGDVFSWAEVGFGGFFCWAAIAKAVYAGQHAGEDVRFAAALQVGLYVATIGFFALSGRKNKDPEVGAVGAGDPEVRQRPINARVVLATVAFSESARLLLLCVPALTSTPLTPAAALAWSGVNLVVAAWATVFGLLVTSRPDPSGSPGAAVLEDRRLDGSDWGWLLSVTILGGAAIFREVHYLVGTLSVLWLAVLAFGLSACGVARLTGGGWALTAGSLMVAFGGLWIMLGELGAKRAAGGAVVPAEVSWFALAVVATMCGLAFVRPYRGYLRGNAAGGTAPGTF